MNRFIIGILFVTSITLVAKDLKAFEGSSENHFNISKNKKIDTDNVKFQQIHHLQLSQLKKTSVVLDQKISTQISKKNSENIVHPGSLAKHPFQLSENKYTNTDFKKYVNANHELTPYTKHLSQLKDKNETLKFAKKNSPKYENILLAQLSSYHLANNRDIPSPSTKARVKDKIYNPEKLSKAIHVSFGKEPKVDTIIHNSNAQKGLSKEHINNFIDKNVSLVFSKELLQKSSSEILSQVNNSLLKNHNKKNKTITAKSFTKPIPILLGDNSNKSLINLNRQDQLKKNSIESSSEQKNNNLQTEKPKEEKKDFAEQVLPIPTKLNRKAGLEELPVIPVGKTGIDRDLADSMDKVKPAAGSLAAQAVSVPRNLVDNKLIKPSTLSSSLPAHHLSSNTVASLGNSYEQINLNKPILLAALDIKSKVPPTVLSDALVITPQPEELEILNEPLIEKVLPQKIEQVLAHAVKPLSNYSTIKPMEVRLQNSLSERIASGRFQIVVPYLNDFNASLIQHIVGLKGKFNKEDNILKFTIPRNDLNIIVNGTKLTSAMGLTSSINFYKNDRATTLQGNIVLTEEEVNSAVFTAIENNLNVTELHNHYLWESPKIIFMHIEAIGPTKKLAESVHKLLEKIKETEQGNGDFPIAVIDTANTKLNPNKIAAILETEGSLTDGVYKVNLAKRHTKANQLLDDVTRQRVEPIATFAGTDDEAVLDGDLAMRESALQKVLVALHRAKISIVSINQRMAHDQSRYVVLHYWGVGKTRDLAKGLRAALEATAQKS